MADGWRCPVCGRGVAPGEKSCDHGGGLGVVLPSVYSPRSIPDTTAIPNTVPRWPETTWSGSGGSIGPCDCPDGSCLGRPGVICRCMSPAHPGQVQ